MTISETMDRQAMSAEAAHQLWGSQRVPMTDGMTVEGIALGDAVIELRSALDAAEAGDAQSAMERAARAIEVLSEAPDVE